MPRYEIQSNGRTFEIDAPSMPTADRLKSLVARMGGGERKTARPEDFTDAPKAPEGSAISRFASNAAEMLNPWEMAKGIGSAVRHPIDTAGGLLRAQGEQFGKARDAFDEGRYAEALGHGGAGLLPVLGPVAATVGEQIGEGDVAGGLGAATGILAPMVAGRQAVAAAAKGVSKVRGAAAGALTTTPEVAEAVRFGLANGVPVDAATATGNRVVRGAKDLADRTLGGAVTGTKAQQMRAESMARLGKGLAEKSSRGADQAGGIMHGAETAESAGTAVRGGIEGAIQKSAERADAAYGRVRQAEKAATPDVVQTGTKRVDTGILDANGQPFTRSEAVIESQPLSVPLAEAKSALKPIYDALMKKRELTGQLMGAEGRAAVALDALVNGADAAPLSVVDAALGDIKSLARGADMPELRSAGQGLAAEAVKNLETAVQQRAKAAGVWDDLREGRDATIAKWDASDVRDLLRAEPAQTHRMLTSAGDSAIDRLRAVKRVAPGEATKVGRAYLDGLLDTATAEGGFGREAKLWSDWQKLGDETKAIIYPDKALRSELDKFFLLGKKMAENSNPSGSGYTAGLGAQGTLLLFEPVTGASTAIAGGVLSKALNSPTVAKLLTQAMQTPRTATASRSLSARLRVALQALPAATAAARSESASPSPRTAGSRP